VASSLAISPGRRFIFTASPKEKRRKLAAPELFNMSDQLLDLGFLEFDMLANDRVIFLHGELFGFGTRVLLRHIEIAGIGGGLQFNLYYVAFGHNSLRSGIWTGIDPTGLGKSRYNRVY
jgi:hypothetical protein